MMTGDMDRTLTVPRRAAAVTAARDDAPQRLPSPPPPRRTPAERVPSSPPVHPVRRVVIGVVIGALTMFAVAALDSFTGAEVPVLGSFAALPAAPDEPEIVEVPPPPSTPGTCLTWSRADAADTAIVDCAEPHLFEQAGSVLLTDQVELPDDAQWRQLVNERCEPVVLTYLGGLFDPDGRFRVGALKPSQAKWEQGDRELRCGLQSASRSGALYPIAGRVAESDQSDVQEPGTCLAIDGRTIGDPVDCAGLHSVETAGIVDLSAQFPDAFPESGAQDAFLQPECSRIAAEYAGGAEVISGKGLTVYWDNLTVESWNAGTRRVNCNLAALLPDRNGFAPVTGPVRGEVVVGQSEAPPATGTPDAGVPAPPTTSAEVPPSEVPPAGDPGAPPAAGEGEVPPPGGEPSAAGEPPPELPTDGVVPVPVDGT